ncbi:hypothetical protein [Roseivirga pacifica]|uniref:hypothetical protein n=1 Tax=Roseivirga pacifica TaxID=1267423 RepID=UPI003BA8FD28
MADLTGKIGFSISGKTLFTTNSENIVFVRENRLESVEIATYSTSKSRCFTIEADGLIYVNEGSSFESIDIDDLKEFNFKVLQD